MKILPNTKSTLKIPMNSFRGEAKLGDVTSMPGFNKIDEQDVVFRPTGANIKYILHHWPEAQWVHTAKAAKDNYLALLEENDSVESAKNEDVDVEVFMDKFKDVYKFNRKPKKHQALALNISWDKTNFALFMKQGTGKTKVSLDNVGILYKMGLVDTLVVIAWPNGIHRNWVDYEIHADIGPDIKYKALYWKGGDKATIRNMQELAGRKDLLKIFTFNIECVNGKEGKKMLEDILYNNKNNMLLIDQSACIKNHAAIRTKYLVNELSNLAKYRRILDGDPVAEGSGELYTQMNFLDKRIIGHDTWTAFKAEFCDVGFHNNIIGYRNIEELQRRIAPYSIRVNDDVLDLPDRIWRKWKFDLNPDEQRIYNELKKHDLAFFKEQIDDESTEFDSDIETDNFKMLVPLALTKQTRLQQVAGGFFYNSDKKELIPINEGKSSRIEALEQLLQHIGKEPVVIFARFKHDIENIKKFLGDKAGTFYGGNTDDEKSANKAAFLEGRIQYLIGSQPTLGIGHTLTVAKHIIFYSNHAGLRFRIESEKRVHRMGLTWAVQIWDILATKTTDYKTMDALKTKKALSDVILNDPDDFFLLELDEGGESDNIQEAA